MITLIYARKCTHHLSNFTSSSPSGGYLKSLLDGSRDRLLEVSDSGYFKLNDKNEEAVQNKLNQTQYSFPNDLYPFLTIKPHIDNKDVAKRFDNWRD